MAAARVRGSVRRNRTRNPYLASFTVHIDVPPGYIPNTRACQTE